MNASTALKQAVSADAFESRYRVNPDPWNYTSSQYERDKYKTTLAALLADRYRTAFEPGCSIGELTAMLADRCDNLLATDISASAVAIARRRCADLHNVTVECDDLRSGVPVGAFDLILMSEIGYYFDVVSLTERVRQLENSLNTNGEFLAVHWLGHSKDHILHGNEVHQVLLRELTLRHVRGERHPGFRLDCWTKS